MVVINNNNLYTKKWKFARKKMKISEDKISKGYYVSRFKY